MDNHIAQNTGCIIMFDGPDGVGKSTQTSMAAKALQSAGFKVEVLHVMGGSDINDAIRSVMFSDLPRPAETDAYLSLAMHYALSEKLQELKRSGTIVLVDRSALSLMAYQVFGGGVDPVLGHTVTEQALKVDNADLIIVYEAPEGTLKQRRTLQLKAKDYFEKKDQGFHRRTVEGYAYAAKKYGAVVIDASDDIDDVHAKSMEAINSVLAGK